MPSKSNNITIPVSVDLDITDLVKGIKNAVGVNFYIPEVNLNAKQSAKFLGVAHNTLIRFMEKGHIHNAGTGARIEFALRELFDVLPNVNQLKY